MCHRLNINKDESNSSRRDSIKVRSQKANRAVLSANSPQLPDTYKGDLFDDRNNSPHDSVIKGRMSIVKSSFIAGGCAAGSVQRRTTLRQSDKGCRQRAGTSRMELLKKMIYYLSLSATWA